MFEVLFAVGLMLFVALMWFLSVKWDEYAERECMKNTEIEEDYHDLQLALLRAHHKNKNKKRKNEK